MTRYIKHCYLSLIRCSCLLVMFSGLSACAYLGDTAGQDQEQMPSAESEIKSTPEQDEKNKQAEQKPFIDIPSNPYLSNQPKIDQAGLTLFASATAAMGEQHYDEAEKYLFKLTEDYPHLSGPFLNLGLIAKNRKHYTAAEQRFKQAIERNSNNVEAYNQLAVMYRELGQFELAENYYQQALAVWPGYLDIYLNLGMLYELYMGELKSALQQYQRYQSFQQEPDRRVNGWIKDLQRRIAKQEAAG